MGYYERKLNELKELLRMLGKEKSALTEMAKREKESIDRNLREMNRMRTSVESRMQEVEEAIAILVQEKTRGFPWLVRAYNDYWRLQDLKEVKYLEEKSHPAPKSAERLRQLAKERRVAERAARIANNLLQYCQFLAPWLDEYIGADVEELDQIIDEIHSSWEKKEEEFDEEVKRHFGPKYEGLSATERLQKKLDWYWDRPNKSNWQIGRDYERYIGYLYENKGWDVYYHGKKGFEDLGRDLICKKSRNVEIIQCKYWAKEKVIHEKHIYYLFGTTVEYYIDNFGSKMNIQQLSVFPDLVREKNVVPKLIATVEPSTKADQVAEILGVAVEIIPFQRYPSVKCNVSRRTGEKIFHLPFDQQYDNILIEEEKLERYVETVTEAEALGFRHAYRWKGESGAESITR